MKSDALGLSVVLAMVSGFGPSLAALVVVTAFSDGKGFRDWRVHCLNWRIGWRWFAFALLAPPAVMLIALGINVLLGGDVPEPMAAGHMPLMIAILAWCFCWAGRSAKNLAGAVTPCPRSPKK